MTHAPKIPPEQRSGADHGGRPADEAKTDRRDAATGAQSAQPGDADVNLETQGRFANAKQNLTNQWKTQDR